MLTDSERERPEMETDAVHPSGRPSLPWRSCSRSVWRLAPERSGGKAVVSSYSNFFVNAFRCENPTQDQFNWLRSDCRLKSQACREPPGGSLRILER